jgi:HSP20 family protein
MAITRYNRRRGLRTLDPLSYFFDFPELYSGRMLNLIPGFFDDSVTTLAYHPAIDMYEDDESVRVKLDLPGMSKDEINISFDGHILSITGRREEKDEKKSGSYWSRERFTGEFHRYVHIPSDVDSEKLKANFKDGVLEVILPKVEEAKVKKIAIESGESGEK